LIKADIKIDSLHRRTHVMSEVKLKKNKKYDEMRRSKK